MSKFQAWRFCPIMQCGWKSLQLSCALTRLMSHPRRRGRALSRVQRLGSAKKEAVRDAGRAAPGLGLSAVSNSLVKNYCCLSVASRLSFLDAQVIALPDPGNSPGKLTELPLSRRILPTPRAGALAFSTGRLLSAVLV